MNGILLIDKPRGMTSHDVVDFVRRQTGVRRVGHTGTLDPAATGLLVLCIGPATRLSEFLTGLDKVYEGEMRLGVVTDSYDLDGKVLEERPVPPELCSGEIKTAFNRFTGSIEQLPPMVSAVKVGGERLYKKARKGEVVEREPRTVHVFEFELLEFASPCVRFRLRCSSGTYARALCHDVGEILGCGAALAALTRTKVGRYTLDDAASTVELDGRAAVEQRIIPVERALLMAEVVVKREAVETVMSGGALLPRDLDKPAVGQKGWVQIKGPDGDLLALGELQSDANGLRVQPRRVLKAR